MWFIPILSTYGVVGLPLNCGGEVIKSFDQGWSEFFGGQKLYNMLVDFSKVNQTVQNNGLKIYLLVFILWLIILLFIVLFI